MKNSIGIMLFIAVIFAISSLKLSAQDSSVVSSTISNITSKDTQEHIGVLRLNTDFAKLYVDSIPTRLIMIDSVYIIVNNGMIIDIAVYSGKKKFRNQNAPIGVTKRRFTKIKDRLHVDRSSEYVLLQEILDYLSPNSYMSDDAVFWLTQKEPTKYLTKSSGINSIVDLRFYTDALGLLGNKANGILQTDARLKQYIHSSNLPRSAFFPFQYFKINFSASKFDDNEHYTESANISRAGLLQKSFINTEIALNGFNTSLGYKSLSTFYLDIGGGISLAKLAKSSDSITITMPFLFTELGVNIKPANNFGFDINFRVLSQYSPQTRFNDNGEAAVFCKTGIEFYWNPLENRAGRIFGRGYYVVPFDGDEIENQFLQLQIGYSVRLSDIGRTKE